MKISCPKGQAHFCRSNFGSRPTVDLGSFVDPLIENKFRGNFRSPHFYLFLSFYCFTQLGRPAVSSTVLLPITNFSEPLLSEKILAMPLTT